MSLSALAGPQLHVLLTLSELLTTVIVPPDARTCGVRHERGTCTRLVEPVELISNPTRSNCTAQAGEFPWLVSVRGAPPSRADSPQPLCTGLLVHQQAVLVSAACHEAATNADQRMHVRLGEYNILSDVDAGRPPLDINIRRAVYHPEYSAGLNDVGLLVLEHPARLGEDVNVVCLPQWRRDTESPADLTADWEHTECVLHGWVDTTIDSTPVPLRETVRFLGRDACQTRMRELDRLGPLHTLHAGFACASAETGCWADGGSPLVCRLREDRSRWVLAGLRAWVRQFNDCDRVATYTNVAVFSDWIRDTIDAELSVAA
ncbi:Phenoloxidase-activating factor 2 [Amphibalanus amphitrite]|uniref:Phenoloxidase-activating factor 2 n=1 Tax=Amphibalanus amphitrite TaxID=1232801 RepID=A0A6A4WBQ8_AMPAM|nr:Phenoloxidase-activating factor 2 [Amphibalanus amphitrite]